MMSIRGFCDRGVVVTGFRRNEIIILLGAGASVEAGIPSSAGMIGELESLLTESQEWGQFTDLYFYLKSAIRFSEGIKGRFNDGADNIERLINTLEDLRRGDEHPLYPFIGAWNPRLVDVTRNDLSMLDRFRNRIVTQLRDHWVQPENYDDGGYYNGLARFASEYQHQLWVFSLNYDLCVERNCVQVGIERGFDDSRCWQWRSFDDARESSSAISLMKLHGSIDWTWDEYRRLTWSDSPSRIAPDDLAIIFGTTYKLQYIDPFLFFAYELRRRTLTDAKLVVTVGYGFADEHINGILSQALRADPSRRLLAIVGKDAAESEARSNILRALSPLDGDGLACWTIGASKFFDEHLHIEELGSVFPEESDPFAE